MGITQVEPREAERFEEGIEPEFQDAEVRAEETGEELEAGARVSGAFHGGFGSANLQPKRGRRTDPRLSNDHRQRTSHNLESKKRERRKMRQQSLTQ